mgnify:CR=1 FL=1
MKKDNTPVKLKKINKTTQECIKNSLESHFKLKQFQTYFPPMTYWIDFDNNSYSKHLFVLDSKYQLVELERKSDKYDSDLIHLAKISAIETRRVSDWLLSLTRQERVDLGYMHPGRVDVITAGSLVLAEIIEATGLTSFVASENDILDGMVWSMLNA